MAETEAQKRVRRKEAAGRAWGEGDPRRLFARLEPAAELLLDASGVAPGLRLLDVGAGDGNLAVMAARAGADVVASDLSPVLVERGRERSQAAGVDVQWDVADVEALPYADESFDCVASNFGVIYVDDPRRAVAELERVLHPSGTLALTAWAPSGLMGAVLRLAEERSGSVPAGARPDRWGRYETAMLHFTRFEVFEMVDATLRMEFDTEVELVELFLSPPGPLAGVDAPGLGDELLRLAARHRDDSGPGPVLTLDYAVLSGRRQTAGCPVSASATDSAADSGG